MLIYNYTTPRSDQRSFIATAHLTPLHISVIDQFVIKMLQPLSHE